MTDAPDPAQRCLNPLLPRTLWPAMRLAAAVAAAALVSGIALRACGVPVLRSAAAVVEGSLGSAAWRVETVLKATPLALIGLGLAVAMRAGVWNVGGDGQFLMGCLAGGMAALSLPVDAGAWAAPVMLAAAAAGGALWALGPGLLRARLAANEIIVTVMLNYVAGCVILFLVQGPLKEGYLPQSASLPMGALMGPLAEGGRLHAGPFLALAIALAMAFVMRATAWGFQLRAVGLDARAARAAGMRVSLTQALAFVASGALAGLAGGVELAAVYGRLTNNMCPGYGFLALAAAILARARPVAVLAAAALFGALLVGGDYAERAVGAPKQAIFIFQGVFVMVFAAVEGRLGPAD